MVSKARTKNKELLWYQQLDFSGGINMNKERALITQVADARNVWAPSGLLEQRPGYVWVSVTGSPNSSIVDCDCIVYDASAGTYTNYLSSSFVTFDGAVDDVLYVACDSFVDPEGMYPPFKEPDNTASLAFQAIFWSRATANTNDTLIKSQYWNGQRWAYLPSMHGGCYDVGGPLQFPFLFYAGHMLMRKPANVLEPALRWGMYFDIPKDVTSTTVNGVARRWLRFTTRGEASSIVPAINAELVRAYTLEPEHEILSTSMPVAAFHFNWNNNDNCIVTLGAETTAHRQLQGVTVGAAIETPVQAGFQASGSGILENLSAGANGRVEEVSLTIIPEANEAYIACAGRVMRIRKARLFPTIEQDLPLRNLNYTSTSGEPNGAQVEDREEFLNQFEGIPLETVWPDSAFVLWSNSFLFAANTANSPFEVRWSAPTGFGLVGHRIWPKASRAFVLGSDLTPITGMSQIAEHPLIFKQDSMWRMVYVGEDDEGLAVWEPLRVDGAVGTVSHNSIVPLPVGLAYAYEDGVYLFDGVKSVKISAPLDKLWGSLARTNRYKWTAAHWREKHCYLLAVSSPNSLANNLVLVWDYHNNAWWVWDNLDELVSFVNRKDAFGKEQLFWYSIRGRFYQIGGTHDQGEMPEAWLRTHRFGYKDEFTKRFRAAAIHGTNSLKDLTVRLIVNDRDVYSEATSDFHDDAEALPENFRFNRDRPNGKKVRLRTNYFRDDGEFAQVEIRNSQPNTKLECSKIALGVFAKGEPQ